MSLSAYNRSMLRRRLGEPPLQGLYLLHLIVHIQRFEWAYRPPVSGLSSITAWGSSS